MIKLTGYNIIKRIGTGGMGDVYLAEHQALKKKVAIKSLHKNLVNNEDFRKRFEKEAQTHSKLNHPNIVRLLDYKERKDGLFLIMEYVDGKQLDQYIKKVTGPIKYEELVVLFKQVLDAIGYAHKKGFVHRDVKPSNIMITKDGLIKVLDFGIAKLQEEDKELTKTGIQVGTASYMSPEQVNAKKVDKLTDIYSLGVTLYYMAVGQSPYSDDTNTFSIQTKIVSEGFPSPREFYPGVSEKCEDIILKATQKSKKERYQSCEDFKNAFGEPSKAKEKEIVYITKNKPKSFSFLKIIFYFLFFPALIFTAPFALIKLQKVNKELKNTKDLLYDADINFSEQNIQINSLQTELYSLESELADVKLELENEREKCTKIVTFYNQNNTYHRVVNYRYQMYKNGTWQGWYERQLDPGDYVSSNDNWYAYEYYIENSAQSVIVSKTYKKACESASVYFNN